MNIVEIYKRFPTDEACIDYLEKVRWQNKPTCPYCGSTNQTPLKGKKRYHCNNCNTSFSVTVRTIFHRSHLPLQKWFLAISLILNAKKGISARQLGRDLQVNKDTAWSMAMRVRRAMMEQRDLLTGIVEMDETYIGGKPRKGGGGGNKRGRGTKKAPVIAMVERGGKVKARHVKNTKGHTINALVRENIDFENENTMIMTDEYSGYMNLFRFAYHRVVNHSVWYVDGDTHTNTVESFWALLKRGIVGQYHKVSVRYLPKYIDEFCYRFNQRHNDSDSVFGLTISRAVGIV